MREVHGDPPFETGGIYRNRQGEYEVLAIEFPNMRIRYVKDGREQKVKVDTQARIWKNIRNELQSLSPLRRKPVIGQPPIWRGQSPDPVALITCIDEHLEQKKLPYVTAVEANELLASKGLLRNSASRRGKPLRDLLRDGQIPHAYQDPPGKYGRWHIPHSDLKREVSLQAQAGKVSGASPASDEPSSASNLSGVSSIETVRLAYLPSKTKVLFIGESPPAGGTFFYLGDSILASATMAAFAKAFDCSFDHVSEFLDFFKAQGCFLDDLCHVPVNKMDDNCREGERIRAEPALAERVRSYNPDFVIVVMKAIEGYVASALARFNMDTMPRRTLPFPSYRNKATYVEQLAAILRELTTQGLLEKGLDEGVQGRKA